MRRLILGYRRTTPNEYTPGGLAQASFICAIISGSAMLLADTMIVSGALRYDGPYLEILLVFAMVFCAIVGWILAVVFGLIALVDKDGPRALALRGLAIAGLAVAVQVDFAMVLRVVV